MDEPMKRGPGRPRTRSADPNDPPAIETPERRAVVLPEQQHIEPSIAPPPTVEVLDEPNKNDENRAWTREEADWYEICIRVKRLGGFIKGLAPAGQEKARELMEKYHTKPEEGWKHKPYIPRFDNSSHDHNQKAIYEKAIKVIQIDKTT